MTVGRCEKLVGPLHDCGTRFERSNRAAFLVPGLKSSATVLAFDPFAKILHTDSKSTSASGAFLIKIRGRGHNGISFHREQPQTNVIYIEAYILPQFTPNDNDAAIGMLPGSLYLVKPCFNEGCAE